MRHATHEESIERVDGIAGARLSAIRASLGGLLVDEFLESQAASHLAVSATSEGRRPTPVDGKFLLCKPQLSDEYLALENVISK